VLLVPNLTCNLFSIRVAASKGNNVKFGHTRCWIRDTKGNLCGTGSLINKLYNQDCKLAAKEHLRKEHAALVSENTDLDLWHQRMGHLCEQQLRQMINKGLVTGNKFQKALGYPLVKDVLRVRCIDHLFNQWECTNAGNYTYYIVMYVVLCR